MQSFTNILADTPDHRNSISKKSGFLLKQKLTWKRKQLKGDLHRDIRVNEAIKAHLHQNSLVIRTVHMVWDPLLSQVKCADSYNVRLHELKLLQAKREADARESEERQLAEEDLRR